MITSLEGNKITPKQKALEILDCHLENIYESWANSDEAMPNSTETERKKIHEQLMKLHARIERDFKLYETRNK